MLTLRTLAARAAVAIPAKNEASHIGACLDALAKQTLPPGLIVLCLNNTTDDTAACARTITLPPQTCLIVLEKDLPEETAYAGTARRLAMEEAARRVGADGVLLTTDADGTADCTWVEANLRHLLSGVDAVCGWVDLDPESWSAIPRRLHEDDARECAYDALCDEIAARLDPDAADPTPRHTQNSGASIALWIHAYAACGGVPAMRHGEDRALIAALRRIDACIRHASDVHVTVSGRTEGRAAGGMAETIRRRLTAPDLFLDDRLEPAEACARRACLRAALSACRATPARTGPVAAELGIDPQELARALSRHPFGVVWQAMEARSPALRRRKVAVAELPAQMRVAQEICDVLRAGEPLKALPPQLLTVQLDAQAQYCAVPAAGLQTAAEAALGAASSTLAAALHSVGRFPAEAEFLHEAEPELVLDAAG